MSGQEVRGTLARGGTYRASPDGVEIFAPDGRMIASFGRDVISGVRREGQVVTLERHNDTIVTITAASIVEASDLEQFIAAQLAGAAEAAVDEAPKPPPEPEMPTPSPTPEEAPPQPVPEPARHEQATPTPSPAERQIPGSPAYDVTPPQEGRGNRWLLWGCLGCGGLIVLALIITGIAIALLFAVDVDSDDGASEPEILPTVIVIDPTSTVSGDAPPTSAVEQPADGDILEPGQTAQVEGVEITFIESRIDDEPIIDPEPGNEYLILRFRIVNNNTEEYLVSTLFQFELRDQAGNSYPQTFYAGSGVQLDGPLPPGGDIDGEIAFEVPQGGGPYIVRFTDIFGEESAIWIVVPES